MRDNRPHAIVRLDARLRLIDKYATMLQRHQTASGQHRHEYRKRSASIQVADLPQSPNKPPSPTVLSDMDAELAALEQRRDKTRALKQAMMQELLTGKTRLVSPRGSHA